MCIWILDAAGKTHVTGFHVVSWAHMAIWNTELSNLKCQRFFWKVPHSTQMAQMATKSQLFFFNFSWRGVCYSAIFFRSMSRFVPRNCGQPRGLERVGESLSWREFFRDILGVWRCTFQRFRWDKDVPKKNVALEKGSKRGVSGWHGEAPKCCVNVTGFRLRSWQLLYFWIKTGFGTCERGPTWATSLAAHAREVWGDHFECNSLDQVLFFPFPTESWRTAPWNRVWQERSQLHYFHYLLLLKASLKVENSEAGIENIGFFIDFPIGRNCGWLSQKGLWGLQFKVLMFHRVPSFTWDLIKRFLKGFTSQRPLVCIE